jgi:hypothetical protein
MRQKKQEQDQSIAYAEVLFLFFFFPATDEILDRKQERYLVIEVSLR